MVWRALFRSKLLRSFSQHNTHRFSDFQYRIPSFHYRIFHFSIKNPQCLQYKILFLQYRILRFRYRIRIPNFCSIEYLALVCSSDCNLISMLTHWFNLCMTNAVLDYRQTAKTLFTTTKLERHNVLIGGLTNGNIKYLTFGSLQTTQTLLTTDINGFSNTRVTLAFNISIHCNLEHIYRMQTRFKLIYKSQRDRFWPL